MKNITRLFSPSISILLCLVLLLPTGAIAGPDETSRLREQATSLIRAGNFDEACDVYRQIVLLQPKDVDTLKDYMWALWRAKRYSETAQIARRVTELARNDVEAWNLLGRSELSAGHKEQALEAFQKSLALVPNDPELRNLVGRLHLEARNYQASIEELQEVDKNLGGRPDAYTRLGEAQFRQGLYGQAAATWSSAARRFPENLALQFQAAKSLYYDGQWDKALDKLHSIISTNPGYWPALDFLTDEAIAREDYASVTKLLESHLSEFVVEEEPRLLKLADAYDRIKDFPKCLRTANRLLNVNPTNSEALFLKAYALIELKKPNDAIKVYERILKLNPWSFRAMEGLAEVLAGQHKTVQALRIIRQARELDPTSPHLLLQEASYVYESGHPMESKHMMIDWIKENPEPAVPVLLYHGLTPLTRDALLAYSVHMTTKIFEGQIEALHKSGYTPITTEQLDGWIRWQHELPNKPIVITFDDGRLDSFRFADPVLEKYGMKATMFAIMANVERNLPGYANWGLLNQYRNTGRWEIQAHGDQAHQTVPVDFEGHRELFLANRQWKEKEKRLEEPTEWAERIASDHRSVKKKILDNLGHSPIVYAFPEGEFGQDGVPNSPDAAPLNLGMARRFFGTCFRQTHNGMNVKTQDPMLSNRIEPKQNWSGEQLVRFLIDHEPKTLMYRRLLSQAAWDERFHEAYEWFGQVRKSGASTAVLLADEARIRLSSGDLKKAEHLAQRSYEINPDPNTQRLLDAVHAQRRMVWSPTFEYMEDSKDRSAFRFNQDLELRSSGITRIQLHHGYTSAEEQNSSTITDNFGGLGIVQKLGLYHSFTGQALWHTFNEQVDSTYSAFGRLHSRWTDDFTTEVEGGRAIYETALAMNNNVIQNYGRLWLMWQDMENWTRVSGKGFAADLSDGNNRFSGEFQVSQRLLENYNIRTVYRFTYDNMNSVSTNYYSPQTLLVNQIGAEYSTDRTRPFRAYARYLPGFGSERSTKAEFVHDMEAGFTVRWQDRLEVTPAFGLTTTPTYNRRNFVLNLLYRF